MIRRVGFLGVIVFLFFTTMVQAEWRYDIESKTVDAGDPAVTVGFTFYSELAIALITLPIVVREIDPGSFWTGQLPYSIGFIDPPVGVTWSWANPGWAQGIEDVQPWEGCATPGNGYDGVSPDNFAIECQELFQQEPAAPSGRLFVTLQFAVTSQPGQFEFDTACASPQIHVLHLMDGVYYLDRGPTGTDETTFNKGIITIAPAANVPPVISLPSDPTIDIDETLDISFSATDDGQVLPTLDMIAEDVPGFLSFTDNGDNSGTLFGTPGCGDPGTYSVRCIADDGEFADTGYIVITVNEDNEDPVLTCPGTVIVDCDPGEDHAVVSYEATATDNCGIAGIVYDPPSGSTFNGWTTTSVTVTATDPTGNSDVCTFDVTVNPGAWLDMVSSNITLRPDGDLEFTMTLQDDIPVTPSEYSAFIWFLDTDQTDSEPLGVVVPAHDVETEYHVRTACHPGMYSWIAILDNLNGGPSSDGYYINISGPTVTVVIDPIEFGSPTAIDWFSNVTYTHLVPDEDPFGSGYYTLNLVTCDCAGHCDMDGVEEISPVDVVYMSNYVYKQLDGRPDHPDCPAENGDWDCSGSVNPVDVVWYVNYVYKVSGVGPCDPCACDPYPDNCP